MKKKSIKKKVVASLKKARRPIMPVVIGTGLAAVAAAAAAGTFFLYGSKHASRHRRLVKAWSLKARGEVLERMEKLSEINEEAYHKAITEVASRYKTLKNVDQKDVAAFVDELKSHWKDIAKEVTRSAKKVSKKK